MYRQAFDRFWAWALDTGVASSPAEVATRTLNAYVDFLSNEVAPATVSLYWRNLRPFFSWHAKEFEVPSPYAGADTPGTPPVLVPVIALDDIRALLKACGGRDFEDRRDNAVIRVFVDCGLRRGELVGMRLTDWDRRADLLYVNGKTGPRLVPPLGRHRRSACTLLARARQARASAP